MSRFWVTNLVDYSACSTVVLHGFGEGGLWSPEDFPLSEEVFLDALISSINEYEGENTCDCGDDCCPPADICDYSWVMMSVLTREQSEYLGYLKEIGFETTGPSYNEKNGTEVTWFFCKGNEFRSKIRERLKKIQEK